MTNNPFNFTQAEIEYWKAEPFQLEGKNDTAVIIVHGWSSNPKQVRPYAKMFNERGYWVYAPRLTGHGTHPEDMKEVKAEDWIDDVQKAIGEARKNKRIKRIFVGGISIGANLALIVSTKEAVDGIFLLGAPVHLRNHFIVKIVLPFVSRMKKYVKKDYPKDAIISGEEREVSYQYYPVEAGVECQRTIKMSNKCLKHVTASTIIIQTSEDYLVAKYSPWVIYNSIKSETKKLQWIKTVQRNHVLAGKEINDCCDLINNFIQDIIKGNGTKQDENRIFH